VLENPDFTKVWKEKERQLRATGEDPQQAGIGRKYARVTLREALQSFKQDQDRVEDAIVANQLPSSAVSASVALRLTLTSHGPGQEIAAARTRFVQARIAEEERLLLAKEKLEIDKSEGTRAIWNKIKGKFTSPNFTERQTSYTKLTKVQLNAVLVLGLGHTAYPVSRNKPDMVADIQHTLTTTNRGEAIGGLLQRIDISQCVTLRAQDGHAAAIPHMCSQECVNASPAMSVPFL